MSKKRTVTERTLKHPVVEDRINWVCFIMTGRYPESRRCTALLRELRVFAKKAASLVLESPGTRPDVTNKVGKKQLTRILQARVMKHDVQELITATRLNLQQSFPRLVRDMGEMTEYELTTLAHYASMSATLIVHDLEGFLPKHKKEDSMGEQIRLTFMAKTLGLPAVHLSCEG